MAGNGSTSGAVAQPAQPNFNTLTAQEANTGVFQGANPLNPNSMSRARANQLSYMGGETFGDPTVQSGNIGAQVNAPNKLAWGGQAGIANDQYVNPKVQQYRAMQAQGQLPSQTGQSFSSVPGWQNARPAPDAVQQQAPMGGAMLLPGSSATRFGQMRNPNTQVAGLPQQPMQPQQQLQPQPAAQQPQPSMSAPSAMQWFAQQMAPQYQMPYYGGGNPFQQYGQLNAMPYQNPFLMSALRGYGMY